MNKLKSIFDILEKLCIIIMVISLSSMIVLIFGQVLARYVFGNPSSWTEELSRHLMIWGAFMGAALAYRRGAHMGVDLLINIMPAAVKKITQAAVHVGIGGFSIFLFTMGLQIVQKTMMQFSSALRIPMGYIYLAIPVGAALMVVFCLEQLYNLIKNKELVAGSQVSSVH